MGKAEGRGARGTGEGRGGADRSSSLRSQGEARRVGERSRDAQSRLGPIALFTERVARRTEAPGRGGASRGSSRSCPPPPSRVGAGSRVGAAGAAGHRAPPEPFRGAANATRAAFLPGPPPGQAVELAAFSQGTGWKAGPGRVSVRRPSVQGGLGRTQSRAGTAPWPVLPQPPPPALGFCR